MIIWNIIRVLLFLIILWLYPFRWGFEDDFDAITVLTYITETFIIIDILIRLNTTVII